MDPGVEETRFQPIHMIFYMNLNKEIHDWSSKNRPIWQIESEFAKQIVNSKSITLLLLHHYILCLMTLMIQVTMIGVKTKWIQSDFAQQKVFKMISRMIQWIRTRFA